MPTILALPAEAAPLTANLSPNDVFAICRMRRMVSARQRQIWALLATGLTMKEAAAQLELSERTIASVARDLHFKLGVRNAVGLSLAGIAYGIISVPVLRP